MRRRGVGRGRPSLIGTAARTAVIAGTATAVSGNVASRQHQRAQEAAAATPPVVATATPPSPPPAPAAAGSSSMDDMVAQLRALGELRDAGILTEDEFTAKKAKLLDI